MAETNPKIIVLESHGGQIRREEIVADAVNPGMLLEYTSAGKVDKHSEADGPAIPLFADLSYTVDDRDYPTTASIDIPYSADDTIYMVQGKPGDVIYAWLADGANVKKGRNYLGSNGTGHLDDLGTGNVALGTANPVAIAWETLDNSAGGTAVRCKVLIV